MVSETSQIKQKMRPVALIQPIVNAGQDSPLLLEKLNIVGHPKDASAKDHCGRQVDQRECNQRNPLQEESLIYPHGKTHTQEIRH